MPQISVIVPVYNVEKYLDRCVNSILAQTYTDFELILVDDGSPDRCPAMCDEWAKKDERIIVIHKENGGLSDARNVGIDWAFQNSNSEWLTFIDSDDWVHPQYLEILLLSAINNSTNISICDLERTNFFLSSECEKYNDFSSKAFLAEEAFSKHYNLCISACFALYRKGLFESLRFPLGKLHEDAYITHLLIFNEKFITINGAALYYYFSNSESITKSRWSPRRLDEVEAHELRIEFLTSLNYAEALNREIKAYLFVLMSQIGEVASTHNEHYFKYKKQLEKKLKKSLRRYGKYIRFEEYKCLYEMVYPRFMKFYWIWCSLKNKAKNIFKKGN